MSENQFNKHNKNSSNTAVLYKEKLPRKVIVLEDYTYEGYSLLEYLRAYQLADILGKYKLF